MIPSHETQSPPLKKPDTVALHVEATTDATLPQRETVPAVCQNTFLTHTVTNNREAMCATSAFSKPAATPKDEAVFSPCWINTDKDDCKTEPEPAASSTLNIRERGLMVSRRRPETDLDPLSTFMILRSQQRASEVATPQSPASTAGRLLVLLALIWHFVAFPPCIN